VKLKNLPLQEIQKFIDYHNVQIMLIGERKRRDVIENERSVEIEGNWEDCVSVTYSFFVES
jgi:hypothetical protein